MAEMRSVPPWLLKKTPRETPATLRRGRLKSGFVEKTLHAIAEVMKNEVFSESIANRQGLFQNLDPRAKLVTVLFLIGIAGLFHHIFPLILFNLWLFWLAKSSRAPIGVFAKRVWIVVALFTGVLVLPVLFNVVRPGTPLLVLFHLSRPINLGYMTIPAEVAITRQGAQAAALLMLRVGASVSLAVLLTLTTRWNVLLKALGALGIPSLFLSILEMTYRYIFLLLSASSDMFMARRSRLVGRAAPREERRFVTVAMGSLWCKTAALSEEVHGAMVARGYAGTPRSMVEFTMKLSDWAWIVLVLAAAVLFIGGDRVLG
ncbi:MAG: cobalt ECF transporter T component CbiQ [Syntrophobacteraceae bacterium]|nr:cobalt ECF transporter T component CbiQ [Syntrophobacteraceae bacterium]